MTANPAPMMQRRRSGDPKVPMMPGRVVGRPANGTALRLISSSRKLVDKGTAQVGKRSVGALTAEQTEALQMYRSVGEIRHAISSRARLVSAARLVIGLPGDTIHEDGVPARNPDGSLAVPDLDEAVVQAAEETLAVVVDQMGSQAGLVEATAQLWDTIGECYMVAWWVNAAGDPVTETSQDRFTLRWEVVSPDCYELRPGSEAVLNLGGTDDDKVRLPPDHEMWRLWMRDVARPASAWSWLMSALTIARSVDALTREQLSQALAAALGKVVLVPLEAAPVTPVDPSDPLSGTRAMLPNEYAATIDNIIGDAMEAVTDDSMAGAGVVAAVVAVPSDYVDKFGNAIDLSRESDPGVSEALRMSLQRLRESADVSPEMLSGLGDTNRWNGVQVTTEEYKRYHRPLLHTLASMWTTELLWPALLAQGFTPEQTRSIRVIVDPGPIIADPDPREVSSEALRVGAISYAAYRRLNGIDEALAPTPEEREEIKAFLYAARGGAPSKVTAGGGGTPPSTPNPVNQDVGAVNIPVARLVASSTVDLPDVDAMAAAEAELVDALAAAASTAVEFALQRSYNVLRSRATRARLPVTAAGPIPAAMAADIASAVFADEDEANEEMILAALATLRPVHDQLIDDALDQMFAALGMKMPTADAPVSTSPSTGATVDAETVRTARESSWSALVGGLVTWVSRRLFDTVADAAEQVAAKMGRVPLTVVRRALAAAGGASVRPGVEGIRPRGGDVLTSPGDGSLMFGPRFAALAPAPRAWVWVYGDPGSRMRPFEPHLALDGKIVTSPDDDVLTSPEWGGYWPGDHAGCKCQLRPHYEGD